MIETALPIGTRLGKYRITDRIGRGGMGVVYIGKDTHLGRPVAIKLLADHFANKHEVQQRFLREARAAAQINHPNIVTVHDFGQSGNCIYIVMELVGGGTAQSHLQGRGPLPWPEATRIVADICRGLSAAHAVGLIHRDVKPANMLLTLDGTAKLADFGLIKAPTQGEVSLTEDGTILGTPQYMSPEHCSGEKLDERTDIYSLGVSYYTLLVGRPPYDGTDPVKIMYAHCSAPVPNPCVAMPALPPECAQIIRRAMAKSRTERYRTASDMLTDLLQLLSGAPTVKVFPVNGPPLAGLHGSSPNTLAGSAGKHPLRRRWFVVGVASLGLIVVTAGMVGWGVFFRTRQPVPRATEPSVSVATRPADKPTAASFRITLQPRPAPLVGPDGGVQGVSIAGGSLATASKDGTVSIYPADGGKVRHVLHNPVALKAVALSPDGKIVATGGEGKAALFWNAESGEALGALPGFQGTITALAFAPSGKQLAAASQQDLQLINVDTASGKFTRQTVLLRNQYVVESVAFSENGKRLAACTNGGQIYIWDLPGLKQTTAPGTYSDRLTAIALSSDGKSAFFGTYQGQLYRWEIDSDNPPAPLSDKEGCITSLACAPGGTLVSTGIWGGSFNLRDFKSDRSARILANMNGKVEGFCIAPDGKILAAVCSDGSVRLWDVLRIEAEK